MTMTEDRNLCFWSSMPLHAVDGVEHAARQDRNLDVLRPSSPELPMKPQQPRAPQADDSCATQLSSGTRGQTVRESSCWCRQQWLSDDRWVSLVSSSTFLGYLEVLQVSLRFFSTIMLCHFYTCVLRYLGLTSQTVSQKKLELGVLWACDRKEATPLSRLSSSKNQI